MKNRFTITDALSLKRFLYEFSIALTSDGALVAYVVTLKSWLKRTSGDFSPTGAPSSVAGCEIWVTETGTRKTSHLTSGWGTSWAPVWSPDDQSLAAMVLSSDETAKTGRVNRDLVLIPFDGSELNLLVQNLPQSRIAPFTWSPDSRRIAYLVKGNIWVVSREGGVPRNLTETSPTGGFNWDEPPPVESGRRLSFRYRRQSGLGDNYR